VVSRPATRSSVIDRVLLNTTIIIFPSGVRNITARSAVRPSMRKDGIAIHVRSTLRLSKTLLSNTNALSAIEHIHMTHTARMGIDETDVIAAQLTIEDDN
jgi:hypothetical protein